MWLPFTFDPPLPPYANFREYLERLQVRAVSYNTEVVDSIAAFSGLCQSDSLVCMYEDGFCARRPSRDPHRTFRGWVVGLVVWTGLREALR